MGHFGSKPIRLAWFALVLPALVLNYLGQGALLLINPDAEHPFFVLAPSWALLPLVAHRHGGGDHRVAGADLRLVLDHAAGGAARSGAAPRRRAHLGPRDGPDLCAARQLGADGRDGADRDRLRLIRRHRRRLRHRRHADDDHHGAAALRRDDRALAVAEAGCRGRDGLVPDDRPRVLRRQRAEDHAGRLAAAGRRGRAVHADDDVADRPADRGGAAGQPRRSARGLLHASSTPCSRCACRAPRST